ncbi:MAG: hypothetical protein KAI02_04055 [Gammaproteobacteria bacterium]|nr:hypothetical protein [Gammaproteobacteria bacterium]
MTSVDNDVNYSVVFMGEIITGFEKNRVMKNVAHITRLPIDEIEKKFFREKIGRLVIKTTDDLDKAKKYHGKFSRAGMAVGIQMEFKNPVN